MQFEKEYMGRGPEETKTYIIDDVILVQPFLLANGGMLSAYEIKL
ncbi:MAG: Na-translocating system protein MpsC family protein [Sedimentisphaerales bacterium]